VPNDEFSKFLEGLDKEPQPEPEPAAAKAAPEAPADPPDPFAHLIGHGGAIQEQSPFDAFLDKVVEEAPKDLPEPEPQYELHDWQTIQAAQFEDDHHVWRCRRCFRQINVKGDQTLEQALATYNVNPNCGEQVAAEVMES
jgi:hypothetical protein